MGNTCTLMADSSKCMTKPMQYCKVKKKKDMHISPVNIHTHWSNNFISENPFLVLFAKFNNFKCGKNIYCTKMYLLVLFIIGKMRVINKRILVNWTMVKLLNEICSQLKYAFVKIKKK